MNARAAIGIVPACAITASSGVVFAQQSPFSYDWPLPAGDDTVAIAAGDLNGDGIDDLATANGMSDDASICLGVGAGAFELLTRIPTSIGPNDVALADLDLDGEVDLLVSHAEGTSRVRVWLGLGGGDFGPPEDYIAGALISALTVADLNNDTFPDVVVSRRQGNVSVLLGTGDGTLQTAVSYLVGRVTTGVVAVDLNGDGNIDVAVTNRNSAVDPNDGSVSVMLGAGDGTLGAPLEYIVKDSPEDIVAADFNGDGAPDLATTSFSEDTVSVLIGFGDGTFQGEFDLGFAGNQPEDLLVLDFNADEIPDLFVNATASSSFPVLLGLGDGTFDSVQFCHLGTDAEAIVVAETNGDGRADLVVASPTALHPLVGWDGPGYALPGSIDNAGAGGVVSGDFDSDGLADLAFPIAGSAVGVMLGAGDGSFLPRAEYTTPIRLDRIVAADINGDNVLDLVMGNSSAEVLVAVLGAGDGSFGPPVTSSIGHRAGALTLADFDEDGLLDVGVETGQTATVMLGVGGGAFQADATITTTGPQDYFTSIGSGDFNDDGHADLVLAEGYLGQARFYLGSGDGTFQHLYNLNMGEYTGNMVVHDIDGDGRDDVIACNVRDSDVTFRLGAPGDAMGSLRSAGPSGVFYARLAAADVNLDGFVDLVVSGEAQLWSSDAELVVLLGGPGETFVPTEPVRAGSGAQGVALADFDADGDDDVVAALSGCQGSLLLLENSTFLDAPCSGADLGEPFGVLDFTDIIAFLSAFAAMDPAADLALPVGVFDFSDVLAFLGAFGAGCP